MQTKDIQMELGQPNSIKFKKGQVIDIVCYIQGDFTVRNIVNKFMYSQGENNRVTELMQIKKQYSDGHVEYAEMFLGEKIGDKYVVNEEFIITKT